MLDLWQTELGHITAAQTLSQTEHFRKRSTNTPHYSVS
jgi:hypothetical protein